MLSVRIGGSSVVIAVASGPARHRLLVQLHQSLCARSRACVSELLCMVASPTCGSSHTLAILVSAHILIECLFVCSLISHSKNDVPQILSSVIQDGLRCIVCQSRKAAFVNTANTCGPLSLACNLRIQRQHGASALSHLCSPGLSRTALVSFASP